MTKYKRKGYWQNIYYFSPQENWGDPDKVDPMLVMVLDELRGFVGRPFHIHCAYETSGHSPNSYHYLGRAVDFHVDIEPFLAAVYLVDRALQSLVVKIGTQYVRAGDICGLGAYYDWNNKGFHLDTRGWKVRWRRVKGQYKYDGLFPKEHEDVEAI